MTRTEYEKLKSSGMMWEFHPEFTGVYEEDIPQRSNAMTDQDRAEFEAWCRNHQHADAQGERVLDAKTGREFYMDPAIDFGWDAWLAARKGMVPAADVLALCEAVELISTKPDEPTARLIGVEHAQEKAAALKQKIKEQDDES